MDNYQNNPKISKVVYNDRLGYAIVYYRPISKIQNLSNANAGEKSSYHRSIKPRKALDVDLKLKRFEEKQQKETQNLINNIRTTSNQVRDLFKRCEEYDMSRRDFFNDKVKARIKGKRSQEICDIIVDEVLRHVKHIYWNDLDFASPKMEYQSSIKARDLSKSGYLKLNTENRIDVIAPRIERHLYENKKNLDASIFERKCNLMLDNIRRDVGRCYGLCYKSYARNDWFIQINKNFCFYFLI